MSTSAIREPRSVAQTPLHSSGSGAGGGGGDVESKPATPAVQTPDESESMVSGWMMPSIYIFQVEPLLLQDLESRQEKRN